MRFCLVCALLLGLVGCGGGKGYQGAKRYAVSGKVTFNGEPLNGGGISFMPQDEKQRPTSGQILNGEYTIPEGQGVNEGLYRVEIRWMKPTGKQVLDKDDTGQMIDVFEQVIPKKYNDLSELKATISASATKFDFDLKAE